MKIFGQLVRTTINLASLPIAVVKDAVTLGGAAIDRRRSFTEDAIDRLKAEAEETR